MAGLKIMVVEDEPIVALDIGQRLERLGYALSRSVSSGEEAVSAVGLDKPGLVLMDIMLAGEMDGIQAALEIQSRHDIPIIYLTAYADPETINRAKLTGPFGYIIKPFEDREIQTAIEMAFYRHETGKREKERRQWLSATLESIGEGVVTTDAEGCVTYMNGVAEVLTGWKFRDAVGRDLSDVFRILEQDEDDGVLLNVAKEVIRKKRIMSTEDAVLLLGKDRKIPMELFATPILDERRSLTGMVLAFRDITGRKQAVEALEASVVELRRTLEETVNALTAASEKRDPYTAGHQQRVSRLAYAIAGKMKLPHPQVEGIRVASLLHDIGKIYVPAEILAKPAGLTEMEFAIVKTHPQVGYDILKNIPFPWPVAEIVLQHHERMDGSGYLGLKGEDTLLEARIIAVSDVVEAMSSHRPYRAALGLDTALDEISKNRKIRYDPDVVDACLELFRKENFTFD